MDSKCWWRVTAEWQELDTLSGLLFEIGIQGLQQFDQYKFECFLNCTDSEIPVLIAKLSELGVTIISHHQVEESNWLKKCEEIWQPVQIGKLRIVPVMDSDSSPITAPASEDILIVPGEGFGTGHHHSTRFAIELMQTIHGLPGKELKALDVGCGSGILALAANRLFEIPVTAIDNDPVALLNADRNINLNHAKDISTGTDSLNSLREEYSLIAANIYAEVLISMRGDFKRLLLNSGYLILSGIMSNLLEDILENFSKPDWELIETRDSGEWSAVLFKNSKI